MTDRAQSSLELLYNISRQLVSSLNLRTVLERILTLSTANLNAERGIVIVLDHQRQPVEAAIVHEGQLIPYTLEQVSEILHQGLAGLVLRTCHPELVSDTMHDERWFRRPYEQDDSSASKSAICVPLTSRDQLVGVLTLVHPVPGYFTDDHLALLQAIGDQAGIAIYNAQLYDSLQVATLRYRELFDNSIDPILVTDWNGQILEMNRQAERIAGHRAELATEHSILTMHEPNWEKLGSGFGNLRGGETVTYESVFRTATGQQLPVEIYVYKVRLQSRDDLQWTVRDITARKELDVLRNDLAAMIYHDLRSPLSNIVSSLDMLEGLLPVEDMTSLRMVFGIATRSTERMQRLISSLLDINRLEEGQPITNQKEVEAQTLAREAVEAIQPTIDGKHQLLCVTLAENLPGLWIDEDMIRRVLINLLENATKFTPNQGEILLQVDAVDREVRFCVQDSGPGIPAAAHELIFEKFRRLGGNERYPKGLGLGLSFCRLAVQAHGGRIWVESEEGRGSRFFFTLPVRP